MRKVRIYKCKNFEEANKIYFEHWLRQGKNLEELDNYEYIRTKVRAYPPGIYKFKTIEEKERETVLRVVEMWDENR